MSKRRRGSDAPRCQTSWNREPAYGRGSRRWRDLHSGYAAIAERCGVVGFAPGRVASPRPAGHDQQHSKGSKPHLSTFIGRRFASCTSCQRDSKSAGARRGKVGAASKRSCGSSYSPACVGRTSRGWSASTGWGASREPPIRLDERSSRPSCASNLSRRTASDVAVLEDAFAFVALTARRAAVRFGHQSATLMAC